MRDFVGELRVSKARPWRSEMKGKLRSLGSLDDLGKEISAGTVWDWVIDQSHDERTAKFEAGQPRRRILLR